MYTPLYTTNAQAKTIYVIHQHVPIEYYNTQILYEYVGLHVCAVVQLKYNINPIDILPSYFSHIYQEI